MPPPSVPLQPPQAGKLEAKTGVHDGVSLARDSLAGSKAFALPGKDDGVQDFMGQAEGLRAGRRGPPGGHSLASGRGRGKVRELPNSKVFIKMTKMRSSANSILCFTKHPQRGLRGCRPTQGLNSFPAPSVKGSSAACKTGTPGGECSWKRNPPPWKHPNRGTGIGQATSPPVALIGAKMEALGLETF